jgi:hypothetical protein
MSVHVPQLNLQLAWLWIFLGFLSGSLLGLGFHRENRLGGYASHKQRLYRLGHISFFGLALMNLMFYFTVRAFPSLSLTGEIAGWTLVRPALLICATRPCRASSCLIPRSTIA